MFSACVEGPEGPRGETGSGGQYHVVVDLNADNSEATVVLGVRNTFTAEVNSSAMVQRLVWELYDDAAGEILRLDRAPTSGGRTSSIGGQSVVVTGLSEGKAQIVVTALGGGADPVQAIVTVTVEGLATQLSGLEARVAGTALPATFEFTVRGNESLSPQVLDFDFPDTVTATMVTVVIRSDPVSTLSVNDLGSLFTLGRGVSLVLENVTLQGIAGNNRPLVLVQDYAVLIMSEGSSITGNTNNVSVLLEEYQGGGVRVEEHGTFFMLDGVISGNSSFIGGGVNNSGLMIMDDGIISGNTGNFGGGVANFNEFTMNNGILTRNSSIIPIASAGSFGGGLINSGTFTLNDGLIFENVSRQGGGIQNEGEFIMHSGIISANVASLFGGGVVTLGGNVNMHGGTIYGNSTTLGTGGGGGLVVGAGSIFTMINGVVSGNHSAARGGGVDVQGEGVFTVQNGQLLDNFAGTDGGAVNILAGTFNFNNGLISGNNASLGGGVNVASTTVIAAFNFNGGTIYNNTARAMGGGARVAGAPSVINMAAGTSISGNDSLGIMPTQGGGGVMIFNNGVFNMLGGEIIGNESASTGGGVRVNNPGFFNMHNGTISGNTAATFGGGIHHNGATAVLRVVNGTIHGDEGAVAEGLRNHAEDGGSALSIAAPITGVGAAQYGRFAASGVSTGWERIGDLAASENTITVIAPLSALFFSGSFANVIPESVVAEAEDEALIAESAMSVLARIRQ